MNNCSLLKHSGAIRPLYEPSGSPRVPYTFYSVLFSHIFLTAYLCNFSQKFKTFFFLFDIPRFDFEHANSVCAYSLLNQHFAGFTCESAVVNLYINT